MDIIQDIIKQIVDICENETPELLAELQQERFGHQGAFNGHEKWVDNSYIVQKDKERNQPLVDSGNLEKQLSTASNWDVNPQINKNTLRLTIPGKENFINSKYDVLDTGGKVKPYTSLRGNYIPINSVPARPFKEISDQDAEWVINKLLKNILESIK